jgi:hypothetical protein
MVLWNVKFVIWCMEINMDGKDNYKVPTIEEIKEALHVPEIDIKFDNLGRVIRKKNPAKSVLKQKQNDR